MTLQNNQLVILKMNCIFLKIGSGLCLDSQKADPDTSLCKEIYNI